MQKIWAGGKMRICGCADFRRCSYLMHRPQGRCGQCGWYTPVTPGMSDGVSRCGELFDLTDYTARAVWEVPLSQQQFSFPQCHVIYKLSGVAAGTHRPHRS